MARSKRVLGLVFAVFLAGLPAGGCLHSRAKASQVLPLERLRLYETGVGYFERAGTLKDGMRASLPLPAGQIDDALKTLTIVAAGGKARVSGVSFPSNLSGGMARALAGLAPDSTGPVSFRDVLAGLRGQPIELELKSPSQGGAAKPIKSSASGTVIHLKKERVPLVERVTVDAKGRRHTTRAKQRYRVMLLFLDATAKIRRIPLADVVSLRPKSPALRKRLETALTALTKSGRQQRRALKLLSSAKGPITLGYVAETPLFRVSYRLFAHAGTGRQTIQGWALVHNDSDEDWRGVELSLVSGRPDSFLFPLTVPRYLRRPLVHPKRALPSVPQLINTTPDALWGDQLGGTTIGLGTSGTSGSGSASGSGSGYGRLSSRVGYSGPRGSAELEVGNLAAFSKAKASKSGTLFSYRMARPLDLSAHSSALLPFTQAELSTQRITLVDDFGKNARATTLLENTTRQTLPAGTIAFFASGTFVGESFLPRTKPGERHFLEHGTDLDVEVKRKKYESKKAFRKITSKNRGLLEHYLRTRTITFSVQNRDSERRRVYLRLRVQKNAKIEGADRLDFDLKTGHAYAIFDMPKNSKLKKTLTLVEGLSRYIHVSGVRLEMLKKLAEQKNLPPTQRAALLDVIAKRAAVEAQQAKIKQHGVKRRQIERQLKRLRAHLKALGAKTANAAVPLVERLLAAEDALIANQRGADPLALQKKTLQRTVKLALDRLEKVAK